MQDLMAGETKAFLDRPWKLEQFLQLLPHG